ncbi:hypothetical protein ACWDUM_14780 [Rhodococcus sp. NPDC003322]
MFTTTSTTVRGTLAGLAVTATLLSGGTALAAATPIPEGPPAPAVAPGATGPLQNGPGGVVLGGVNVGPLGAGGLTAGPGGVGFGGIDLGTGSPLGF